MKFVYSRQPMLVAILTVFLQITLLSVAVATEASSARFGGPRLDKSGSDRPGFDGPAELPRIYLKTSVADTPAPGKVHTVNAGDNLQAQLDKASCGDTLSLEPGAAFSGRFVLPQKNCDDSHWIVIRTSAADSELPAEGSRLTPCYAGVPSLPGRPDFHCHSTKNVLAKLVFEGRAGEGPVVLAPGANHYRIEGLEITRGSADNSITALVATHPGDAANHIILDRVWVHGTAQAETTRGVYLTGTSYFAIVDSFFSDFHCVAVTGSCTDAQAVSGGGGNIPSGPYKIVNNFLEASGENILFGGGAATITPADIEIRHNHLFKPLIWKPNQPGFIGGTSGRPFIVKNLFEVKNAQRVLFEGNILENSWGGFSQAGFAILLTPKNQSPNVCPLCKVTDITLRYCKIRHMASGMTIANVPSDTGGLSTAGERYSIHDLVFEDIDGSSYGGFGAFAMVISNGPQLRDVKIDHVTAFPPRVAFNIGADRDRPLPENFSFTNSILTAGEREVTSSGGKQNCAAGLVRFGPEAVFKSCFSAMTFRNNVIIAPNGHWPSGNSFPKNEEAVGFLNYNHGQDGDYHLCKAKNETASCKRPSPYVQTGSDGKDPGADIDAVEAAARGAE
jgi:hypothetical protein